MTSGGRAGRLNKRNTGVVRGVKIGTCSPVVIWVHQNDLPLEEGKHFRYIDREPTSHGFYPEYGLVYEVRGRGSIPVYFVTEGMQSKVEALDA